MQSAKNMLTCAATRAWLQAFVHSRRPRRARSPQQPRRLSFNPRRQAGSWVLAPWRQHPQKARWVLAQPTAQ